MKEDDLPWCWQFKKNFWNVPNTSFDRCDLEFSAKTKYNVCTYFHDFKDSYDHDLKDNEGNSALHYLAKFGPTNLLSYYLKVLKAAETTDETEEYGRGQVLNKTF